jgi:hypothetical protein
MLAKACFFIAVILNVAPASACNDGQSIDIDGTVSMIFPNKANTWTVQIANLNDTSAVMDCDFAGLVGGQTTAGGLWMMLTTPSKPPSCRVGSPITATIKTKDDFIGMTYDTVSLSCD